MQWYGSFGQARAPATTARTGRGTLALVLSAAVLLACAGIVGLGVRGAVVPAARAQLVPVGVVPQGQTQLVAVLQPEGPAAGRVARKSRRTLALEAYLNTVCVCAALLLPPTLSVFGVCARGEALDARSPEYMCLRVCAYPLCAYVCRRWQASRVSTMWTTRPWLRASRPICACPPPPRPPAPSPRPVPWLPSSPAAGRLGTAAL